MSKSYRISFRTNALAAQELKVLCQLWTEKGDVDQAAEEAITHNLFLHNSVGSAKRQVHELKHRLRDLPKEIVKALPDLQTEGVRQLSFLSLCLTYPVVAHFVEKLLVEKITVFDHQLTESDVNTFFLRESDEYDELEKVTEYTLYKLKQTLTRALVDARLLSEPIKIESAKTWEILRQTVEPDVESLIGAYLPQMRYLLLPL